MTPSNTPHRLAREATAAELAEEAKQCAELYAAAVAGQQATGLVPHQTLVDRGAALYAAIDRLASLALPQLEEQQRWMPISSAPKDGTELLLWREDCGQFIGSYTSADAFPLTQDEIDMMAEEVLFAKDWFTQWPQAIRLEGSEVPTLWQPLPKPPTQDTTTQEKPNE